MHCIMTPPVDHMQIQISFHPVSLTSSPSLPPSRRNSPHKNESLSLPHRKKWRSRSSNLIPVQMVRGSSSKLLVLCRAPGSSEAEDDDANVCPVDCVREFKTEEEFLAILDRARETGALVVVDFYRTSCGSCKYIEHGFAKLCKGSGDQQAPVVFLKHNVIDEYDEQSEVADRLRIKNRQYHFSISIKMGR